MAEVELKRGPCVGVAVGLVLMMFAGAMVAASQLDAMGVLPEAKTMQAPELVLRGRRLATTTKKPTTLEEKFKKASSSGSSGSSASLLSSSGSSESLTSLSSGYFKKHTKSASATYASGGGIGSWLFQFMIALCYAACYKSKVVDKVGVIPHQSQQYDHDFPYGICDCVKDWNMCLMVVCCPWVRIAHTNYVAGVCGFWETLCCLGCTAACCGMGPCCLNVYFRIHLKDHLGLEDHCLNDMVLACLCLPCITGQQALSVDYLGGYTFKCPCTVDIWGRGEQLVAAEVNKVNKGGGGFFG